MLMVPGTLDGRPLPLRLSLPGINLPDTCSPTEPPESHFPWSSHPEPRPKPQHRLTSLCSACTASNKNASGSHSASRPLLHPHGNSLQVLSQVVSAHGLNFFLPSLLLATQCGTCSQAWTSAQRPMLAQSRSQAVWDLLNPQESRREDQVVLIHTAAGGPCLWRKEPPQASCHLDFSMVLQAKRDLPLIDEET